MLYIIILKQYKNIRKKYFFLCGSVPAALTSYWRMNMPETARYTALVEGNHKKAAITIWPRFLKRTLLLMKQVPSNQKLQKRTSERYELYILISHTDGKEKLHHSSLPSACRPYKKDYLFVC